jgi:protein-disulfide isomerase
LGIGFLGRPVIINDLPIEVVVTVVSNPASEAVAQTNAPNPTTAAPAESAPAAAAPAASSPVEGPESTSGTVPEGPAATGPTPTIMDFVLSDARHFQGDDNAPVTIIEFSDFK